MEKKINRIAQCISAVFSPLLIPTYGLTMLMVVLSRLYSVSVNSVMVVIGVVLLLTGAIPYAIIRSMISLNYVSNVDLTDRRERTRPFMAAFLLYVCAIIYLYAVHLPMWMIAFMIGGVLALLIATIVNRKWKISAHASALGGLTAVAAVSSVILTGLTGLILISSTIIVTGLVCTSRLILGVHTPAQIYAGLVNGFVCVLGAMMLTGI